MGQDLKSLAFAALFRHGKRDSTWDNVGTSEKDSGTNGGTSPNPGIFGPLCDTLPKDWREGLEQLSRTPRPKDIPAARWDALIGDTRTFVERFGDRAARLGWSVAAVFAINRVKPCERYDAAGLVWLIDGAHVLAIDQDKATVRARWGAVQSIYRRARGAVREVDQRHVWDQAEAA